MLNSLGAHARRAFLFLTGNVMAQGLAAVVGLLLARWLSKPDYAIYTIYTVIMGATTVLTKAGVSIGFTAILARHWPDMTRANSLITSAFESRRLVSIFVLPVIILVTAYLLFQNHAPYFTSTALIIMLVVFWWADMRTRIIDQILFFSNRAARVQMLDAFLTLLRLIGVAILFLLSSLNVLTAVALSVVVAVFRIFPVNIWIFEAIGSKVKLPSRADDKEEIKSTTIRQIPVEIYYVLQAQIVLICLSNFGNTDSVAEYGALGRIGQLLQPLQAFTYAICIPIFTKANHRPLQLLLFLVSLCSLPGIGLSLCAAYFPDLLLILVGPAYKGMNVELFSCAAASSFTAIATVFWNMVAHRGWNKFTWVQIPTGLAWAVIGPFFVNVGSVSGGFIYLAGFSAGLVVAGFSDIVYANTGSRRYT